MTVTKTSIRPEAVDVRPPTPPPRRWSTTKRVVVGVVSLLSTLVLLAGGVTAWALNRYVIDHVEIGDVAAYEAQASAARATTAGGDDAGGSVTTSTAAAAAEADNGATASELSEPQIAIRTVVTGSGADTVTAYVARMFVDLGATVAYNLDGGGSSTMVSEGALVNNPLGKGQERGTSDILYVAGVEG